VKLCTLFTCAFILVLEIFPIVAHAASESFCPPAYDTVEKSDKLTARTSKQQSIPACSEVNFGKAVTESYLPKYMGPLTSPVSEVTYGDHNDYKEYADQLKPFFGLANVKDLATKDMGNGQSGETLLNKFASLVQTDINTNPDPVQAAKDQQVYSDIENFFKARYQKESDDTKSNGFCPNFSAAALDPEVQNLFSGIDDGIFCEGLPFTKGELKELMVAVYPAPREGDTLTVSSLKGYTNKFKDDSLSKNPNEDASVEDANLALVKLGSFAEAASGGYQPDDLMKMAVASGKDKNGFSRLIMDINPGLQVWNQPIEVMIDVPYADHYPDQEAQVKDYSDHLQSSDLTAATAQGQAELAKLAWSEAKLKELALRGQGEDWIKMTQVTATFCELKKEVLGANQVCLPNQLLVNQVEDLKSVQMKLITSGAATAKLSSFVKHRIFIQYGNESLFAANADQASKLQVLDYVSVNGRSSWEVPMKKLSDVCASQSLGTRAEANGLVDHSIDDLNKSCAKLQKDHRNITVAVGAFPPKDMKVYHVPAATAGNPDPRFSSSNEDQKKKQVYDFLKQKILTCDPNKTFHLAAQFMDQLKNVVRTNAPTKEQIAALAYNYNALNGFLNKKDVEDEISDVIHQAVSDPALAQAEASQISAQICSSFSH
jgi:hypothetical protein